MVVADPRYDVRVKSKVALQYMILLMFKIAATKTHGSYYRRVFFITQWGHGCILGGDVNYISQFVGPLRFESSLDLKSVKGGEQFLLFQCEYQSVPR